MDFSVDIQYLPYLRKLEFLNFLDEINSGSKTFIVGECAGNLATPLPNFGVLVLRHGCENAGRLQKRFLASPARTVFEWY